jgi:tetratricopeptide (TPR) repeat protein
VLLVVGCVALLALPALGKESKLSSECIGKEAEKALTCPAGKKHATGRRRLPHMQAERAEPKTAKAPPKPPRIPEIDPNAAKKRRSLSLLLAETIRLQALVKSTKQKSPDRLRLLRRLADDYAEIGAVALSTKARAEANALAFKDAKRKARARAEARKMKLLLPEARKGAIRFYTQIKNQHPTYSKLDEILYYLAYEYEQAGDLKRARTVYYELIQKAPTSPYVPRAYLAFGELFFAEATGDPQKWGLAEAAYREVLKYPAPNNKVYGIARYKLAYVYWNQEKLPEALNELKKVIEFSGHFSHLPGSTALGKNARRDIVTVYAASGAPAKAWAFLQPLFGEKTIATLDELGIAYLDIGQYADAITLYRQLGERDAGVRSCHYQAQIAVATQAWKSSDKAAIVTELTRLLSVREASNGDTACSNKTAELVTETAMAWHLEAVGSGGVRGTRDAGTMDRAGELYAKVVKAFTKEEFANFRFPRFVREDWPTLATVQYAQADLAYERGRFAECAKAFDAVFASDPDGKDAPEAAYGALLCYQKLRDQTRAGRSDRESRGLGPGQSLATPWSKLAPLPLADSDRDMLAAFDRYLCWLAPPANDREAKDQEAEVEFARARTYYEARHWEEAALGFRHIALEHSKHDAGIYAAQLYLESMNVLGSKAEPPRGACISDMAADVPKFSKLYCGSDRSDVPREQCEILARVEVGLERATIEQVIKRADALPADSPQAIELYTTGADRYRALWREQCEGPLSKGERPKRCERAEEILYNMARAYQAARLMGKAILAREMLLDPRYGLDGTPLAQKALWELALNHQALAVYDRAAELYEKYVEKTCKAGKCGEQASTALYDAALLRLGLADPERAIDNAGRFERWFGRKEARKAAELRFAVASHYAARSAWGEVVKKLGGALAAIDKHASLDVQIQAHALMGRAQVGQKDRRLAAKQFDRVLSLWSDPDRAVASIKGGENDNIAHERRLGRALESVGEALFFFAEQKKAQVDAVTFPVYKGPGTKALVLDHINTKVVTWIQRKRPLIEDATKEYEKIVKLRPSVPPRWAIAAGSDVGDMWGTFVKEFRAAPIPDSIKNDTELRNAYYAEIDRASEPQKKLAKRAYVTCLGYSVKYQYWDSESRSCEEWLAQYFKAEYHLVDEFRGTPTRRNDPLRELARPVRLVSGTKE